ncbi:MAG TPA: epoxide hydrolase N-terminal domain-containing protein, partial [Inquilinus sp.]|nr:epoxide hydrolase N-terminal domain-containing protein [Inquilinus sp.]
MSEDLPSPTRRGFLATSATAMLAASAASAFSLFPVQQAAAAGGSAIRPFQVAVPDADLADLRRRILATRWPAKETVADQSQGVQLARLQALVRYWGTEYDWRKVEAKLNALPMFVTEIDGL